MIFRQVIHEDLGCASYFVGDDGVAAVVDPKLHVEDYLRLARYTGVQIEHVVETHNHADHVSGHGRLAAATGATIHVSRLAEVEYEHEPFDDGWELALGGVVLRAVHTPGHRPEHTSFLVIDRGRGAEPWAVLTGDALFVGDTGRPDLAIEPEDGAREIYRSVHERLLDLPAHTELWPGHLGGSLCGGSGMDRKVASSIGYEREHNAGLGWRRTGSCATLSPSSAPSHRASRTSWPATAARCALNCRSPGRSRRASSRPAAGRARWSSTCGPTSNSTTPTSPAPWPSPPFARASAPSSPGSSSAARRWCWWAATTPRRSHAAELAAAVGIDQVAGYLAGGMTSWREEGREAEAIERIDASELLARSQADPRLQIVDVRERSEWDAGHVAGSLLAPYHDLHGLPAGLDPAAPAAAMCTSGQRAGTAASLLQRHGVEHVLHVMGGGVDAWEAAGGAIER